MSVRNVPVLALVALLFVSGVSAAAPRVRMETKLGTIVVELDPAKAPITVANFLRYVDEDRFSTARFYRVVHMDNQPNNDVRIEVIQGGLGFEPDLKRLPEIEHETTERTGILHKKGTISMARAEPGTASSEFFICVSDQPELDFGGKRNPDGQGFAAFGRVVEGMDVVAKIHEAPESNQILLEPIGIRIERAGKGK